MEILAKFLSPSGAIVGVDMVHYFFYKWDSTDRSNYALISCLIANPEPRVIFSSCLWFKQSAKSNDSQTVDCETEKFCIAT